jgi:hypothetical protein
MVHPKGIPPCYFHSAHGFATQTLAYMLDSLVRVSRRVGWKDQVKLLSEQVPVQPECTHVTRSTYQRQYYTPHTRSRPRRRCQRLIPHSRKRYQPRPRHAQVHIARTSAIFPPTKASLTWTCNKCRPTECNNRLKRFDPTPAASAPNQT